MSYNVTFNTKKNYLVTKVHGLITFKLFKQISEEVMTSPEFTPGLNALWDISDADLTDINITDMLQSIVAFEKKYLVPKTDFLKVAIVASPDLMYGLGRMLRGYGDSDTIKHEIFRDIEKAVAWIEKN